MPLSPESRQWGWLVLAAFSLNTACNSFMFMDFAAVSGLAKAHFNCTAQEINLVYSASLFTVLPFAIPAARYLNTHNYLTTGLGVTANVIGAWLRWWGTHQGDYVIVLLSSMFIGAAAAVIICSVAQVGARWFSDEKTKAMTGAPSLSLSLPLSSSPSSLFALLN